MDPILYVDLLQANSAEQNRIAGRINQLQAIIDGGYRPLTPDGAKELVLLMVLSVQPVVDPMFFAVQYLYKQNYGVTINSVAGGKLALAALAPGSGAAASTTSTSSGSASGPPPAGSPAVDPQIVQFVELYGLLETDQAAPPVVTVSPAPPQPPVNGDTAAWAALMGTIGKTKYTISPDTQDANFAPFTRMFYARVGEAQASADLVNIVFPILLALGNNGQTIKSNELAQVVRILVQKGIVYGQPNQYERLVNEALDTIQNVGQDQQPSDIGIDLPDLSTVEDNAIVEANIVGLQPIYFAAMFEEMKAFQVVDKLVELFQNGILPIGRGDGVAGNYLYKYWKEAPNRISEAERRNFYARAFGIPGGDDAGMPNREFNDLWIRFISAVSSYIRQNQLDNLLRANIPGAVTQQQVRKSGRDLAQNLSLHGYGMTYFAATDLQKQIKDVITLLSDQAIRSAYGARDMWQVIDQVTALELGGTANTVRYRTMATAGAIVMAWLAKRAKRLSDSSFDAILDINVIRYPVPPASGQKPTSDPTDADLVNACEQWLAVTGTEEAQVEQFAQPKLAPAMTSKPIQVPQVARDVLESAGVSLGLGAGRGYTNGNFQAGRR
jgi:hypothetical protein